MASAGTALSYAFAGIGLAGWIGPLWLGLAVCAEAALLLYYRKRSEPKVKLFAPRVYAAFWLSVVAGGAGLCLVSYVFHTGFSLQEGLACLSVMIGVGYFVNGALTRYRILGILGALWMAGGMACMVVPAMAAPALVGEADARAEALPVGTRQRIEIAGALAGDPEILILDEPTAVLSPDETSALFASLRKRADAGFAVVLITHRLPEVFAGADRLTLLARGRSVKTCRVGDTTPQVIGGLLTAGADIGESTKKEEKKKIFLEGENGRRTPERCSSRASRAQEPYYSLRNLPFSSEIT